MRFCRFCRPLAPPFVLQEGNYLILFCGRTMYFKYICHTNTKFQTINYIQISEVQKNIDEIISIFQKVIFSLVKYKKEVTSENNFWMTSAFFLSFLCNPTVSLQMLVTSMFVNKNI